MQPHPSPPADNTGIENHEFASDRIPRRAYAEANRRGSPVSTLGPAADLPWRAGGDYYDSKDPLWGMGIRRDSVSTLGLSRNTPSLDLQQSTQDHHPVGVCAAESPSTPQGPATETDTHGEYGHVYPEQGTENPQTFHEAPRQNDPPVASAAGPTDTSGLRYLKTTNVQESTTFSGNGNGSCGNGGNPSGIEHDPSDPELPPPNLPPSSAEATVAPESGKEEKREIPPPQPPHVMNGSEYQKVLAQSIGATVTSASATHSPVDGRRENRGISHESHVPLTGQVKSSPVWKTADDVGQSAIVPRGTGSHVGSTEESHSTQHPWPAAQPYPANEPYPTSRARNQYTSARPTAVRRSVAIPPTPDVPEEPVERRQSRPGFSGLVSKIQSKSAASSPTAGKEMSARLRSFRADVRNSLSVHQGRDQRNSSAPAEQQTSLPGTGTLPMEDSKKNIAPKLRTRNSQTERQAEDDGKKKPLGKITVSSFLSSIFPASTLTTKNKNKIQTLLRKSSQRASAEKNKGPPPSQFAEYYAPQYVPRRYDNDSHQVRQGSQPPEPQLRPTSRPVVHTPYYQSADIQQAPDNTLHIAGSSKRYSSPPIVQPDYYEAFPPRTQSQRRTSPSPYTDKPLPPINTNVNVHLSAGPYDNTHSQSPSQRNAHGNNARAYTADLHLRSRSPLQMSPAPQERESPINEDDPASNLGGFHTSTPNTPRVGDQETPWNVTLPRNGGGQEKPLPKIPTSTTSPDSPSGYPLPASNVISPVNPAASDIPPPSPPKGPPPPPLHEPEAIRVVTAPVDPATSSTSALPPSETKDVSLATTTSSATDAAANKESPPYHQMHPPTVPADDSASMDKPAAASPAARTDYADDGERTTQPPKITPVAPRPPDQSNNSQMDPASEVPKEQPESTSPGAASDRGRPSGPSTTDIAAPDKSPVVERAGPQAQPAELPAKAAGDDSSDEVVMLSTAYPGQEWHPGYLGDSD